MDRFYGSRLQGRSRPSPGKQGHLRRRRELCFSPILVWTTKKRDLLRHQRRSGIRTQWGWVSPADGEEKTRDAEDLKEISGSRHYKEGDLDFSLVLENKKSIADAEEEDAAHSLSPTPEYLPRRTLVWAVFLQHSKAGFCNIFFLFARKPFQKRVLAEVGKIPTWHVVIGRISGLKKGGARGEPYLFSQRERSRWREGEDDGGDKQPGVGAVLTGGAAA